MNEPASDEERFLREIERQAQRARHARGAGFLRGLATVGAVGWMVAAPAVVGALVGRWLDQRFHSGIFWTLPLLIVGAALGCISAWRHVQKELES